MVTGGKLVYSIHPSVSLGQGARITTPVFGNDQDIRRTWQACCIPTAGAIAYTWRCGCRCRCSCCLLLFASRQSSSHVRRAKCSQHVLHDMTAGRYLCSRCRSCWTQNMCADRRSRSFVRSARRPRVSHPNLETRRRGSVDTSLFLSG